MPSSSTRLCDTAGLGRGAALVHLTVPAPCRASHGAACTGQGQHLRRGGSSYI